MEHHSKEFVEFTPGVTTLKVSDWEYKIPPQKGQARAIDSRTSSINRAPAPRALPPIDKDAARIKSVMSIIQAFYPDKSKSPGPRNDNIYRELWYEVCCDHIHYSSTPKIRILQRTINSLTGKPSRLKLLDVPTDELDVNQLNLIHPKDREIIEHYLALRPVYKVKSWASNGVTSVISEIEISAATAWSELARLCESGRCFAASNQLDLSSSSPDARQILRVNLDAKCHWEIEVRVDDATGKYAIDANVRDNTGRTFKPSDLLACGNAGVAVSNDMEVLHLEPVNPRIHCLISELLRGGSIKVTREALDEIAVICAVHLPEDRLKLPEGVSFSKTSIPPKPRLSIFRTPEYLSSDHVFAMISMTYDSKIFALDDPTEAWIPSDSTSSAMCIRQKDEELRLVEEVLSACPELISCRGSLGSHAYHVMLNRKDLVQAALKVMAAGWAVELEGSSLRRSDHQFINITSSGIDWLDVICEASFGGTLLRGQDLLQALRLNSGFVKLSDGTLGIIDDAAFIKNAKLLDRFSRTSEDGRIKVSKLHAMLLEMEDQTGRGAKQDMAVQDFLTKVRSVSHIDPCAPPKSFEARLRPYQREGLGWLKYLRDCGFGGCLADDMGLGKTIQVLSILDDHHGKNRRGKIKTASLVIAPKSLVSNWLLEAERFAPNLRVAVLENKARRNIQELFETCDLLIASYQITRSDLQELSKVCFEYVICDEAHYIKNRTSQISRSVKLLKAKHRLALTGTPIENRLDDLASIFEFINPGLSESGIFKKSSQGLTGAPEDRALLSQILRPFLLRRTKAQVLKDLPPKTESTIYCDLTDEEQSAYDSLKKAIRNQLESTIEEQGVKKAQIEILAGLTRLRQASCHLGLVEKTGSVKISTKLDVLLERLRETLAEGEKTLVFSQFTELLKLAKDRLDSEGISYCYLDGHTRHRQGVVDSFNSEAGPPVFLVSLKAGGVGLNLTAASNCFLLDPWWNPAAEAQAIDRAHRIGQTKPVFAYRLIARGTVEEKILTLQATKRELADSILGAGEGAPRALTLADLNLLLS
jgi:superfamily II DNA or RNA helicase